MADELVERIEALEGPDFDTDAAIHRECADYDCGDDEVPAYTGSLDAAMSLIPSTYRMTGFAEYGQGMKREGDWTCCLIPKDLSGLDTFEKQVSVMGRADAATPALALCAAALHARSNKDG